MGNEKFLDVEKLCRERIALVMKVSEFKQENFTMEKALVKKWNDEQIWDLKKDVAEKFQLKWLQLKFFKEKLQSVWFGPRTNLESDLHKVGLEKDSLRNKNKSKVKNFGSGSYYSKDLNQRLIRIDHKGSGLTGTTITCFNPRNLK